MQLFKHESNVDYWDIVFNAQSFLYRQIRRIVGALVAVAKGRLTKRDLYEMLTIPSQESFSNKISVAPPHGLYLANIEFRPKCFTPMPGVFRSHSHRAVFDKPELILNDPNFKNAIKT